MRRLLIMLFALCLLPALAAAAETMPQVGQMAPGFKLQDQNGHWKSLDQYRGQWLVLYFYVKDFTPGCTTELRNYRDDYAALRKEGAQVLAISIGSVKSHAAFAMKYHAPFPMLADTNLKVAKEYGDGVLISRNGMKYAARTTFIIAPNGHIAKIYTDVNPANNPHQVLIELPKLKAAYGKA
ncbi:peroxiredoxin [Metallibacterium sp.]|uniref:peroxiredoxin n=2 Tax=Metallibacterium sp. TaxID=2940281 RepID=UPI0026073D43|nr:peroxiredoxin [Metallibacterium sp.]